MKPGAVVALGMAALFVAIPAAQAQRPSPGKVGAPAPPPKPVTPHREGELDCRNCHAGKHQGVIHMYVGMGGRGTPMIPSHMFQVRVECIACHTAPKTEAAAAALVGQTFRPNEQACVNCHGEKYRGLLTRWTTTLSRMREVVAPKVTAARVAVAAGDPKHPRSARARSLVDDAEFNVRFVELARGVHNVFYAADLLTLANGWADDALAALGKAPARVDDRLVRGGYCAVLCHEAAGVKPRATVTFARQTVPHTRHVTEFGATCTSCHSAEKHKAVTATAATCGSCHHNPKNERCESCHRAEAAFYRGETVLPTAAIAPNVMAHAVTCTGCHDFSQKAPRAAIADKCAGCHETPYVALLREWTTGFGGDIRKTTDAVKAAEAALGRARRQGRATAEAEALLKDAQTMLALVRRAGPAHNPLVADAWLATARQKAEAARSVLRASLSIPRPPR